MEELIQILDNALATLPEGHGVTRTDLLTAITSLSDNGDLDVTIMQEALVDAVRISADRLKDEEAKRPAKPGEAPYFQCWSGDNWRDFIDHLNRGLAQQLIDVMRTEPHLHGGCVYQYDEQKAVVSVSVGLRKTYRLEMFKDGRSTYTISTDVNDQPIPEAVWEILYSYGQAVRRWTAEGPEIPQEVKSTLRLQWAWTGSEWVASTTGPDDRNNRPAHVEGLAVIAFHQGGGLIYSDTYGHHVYEAIPESLTELRNLYEYDIPEGVHYLQYAEQQVFDVIATLIRPVYDHVSFKSPSTVFLNPLTNPPAVEEIVNGYYLNKDGVCEVDDCWMDSEGDWWCWSGEDDSRGRPLLYSLIPNPPMPPIELLNAARASV